MSRTLVAAALLLTSLALAPRAEAVAERTIKARLLEIDRAHDRFRADVAGRALEFHLADGGLLRGFRRGDLVLMRVRGATVLDMRLAVLAAQVVQVGEDSVLLRIGRREERFRLANEGLRRRLRKGEFVRLEVEERGDGTRVITRVY